MRLAVLTTRLFDTPRDGGELCTARLLQALREAGHELVVIGRGAVPAVPQAGTTWHSVGALVQPFELLPLPQRLASLAASLAQGRAWTVQRLAQGGVPARVARLLAAAAQARALDGVVVDHLQAWHWLPGAAPWPAWLVMHNLESDGYAERAQHEGGVLAAALLSREARLLNALESVALARAAAVACLSPADAAHLGLRADRLGAAARVEVLPGYPVHSASRQPALQPPATALSVRVGLLGSWTWGPNRQGLDWMLQQVLPLLPAHCELVLAGSGLDGVPLPTRARWLGRVADTAAFYGGVDVVAVPSLQGSGVQEKAIDAIARARAVVATSHALRGLGPGLPAHVQVADGAPEFAQLCLQCAWAPGAAQGDVQRWAGQRRAAYRDAVARCLQALAPSSTGAWSLQC